ncbi:hypothetical protein HG717_15980 [Rhodococcus erythropolis]|uniref:hypothetical protein n=1 Tax=Rhodococcus erythropolis TaxID=1833 RepID=UPI001C9BBC8C|nr:hypothetical protein [Rhodococcus erythropolis]MBY6385399.1 hypothetical protein [Rhodococcus erythropolis]
MGTPSEAVLDVLVLDSVVRHRYAFWLGTHTRVAKPSPAGFVVPVRRSWNAALVVTARSENPISLAAASARVLVDRPQRGLD